MPKDFNYGGKLYAFSEATGFEEVDGFCGIGMRRTVPGTIVLSPERSKRFKCFIWPT